MQCAPVLVTLLASALAVPRDYNTYVPPPKTYVPVGLPLQPAFQQTQRVPFNPPQQPTVQQTQRVPFNPPQQPTVQQTQRVPYSPPQQQTQRVPYSPPRQQTQRVPFSPPQQPAVSNSVFQVPVLNGGASQLPARYTKLDYSPNAIVNRNPGSGSSGPLGVFVGACSASMVCVPEAMCNPYTGFVRGGLLRETTGPSSQPTVALLRCYRLKDGGVGDGVCCRMPHINDPWPDQQ